MARRKQQPIQHPTQQREKNQWHQSSLAAFLVLLLLASTSYADLFAADRAVRMRQFELAVKLYSAEAKKGNAEAQFQLAKLYESGRGTEINTKEAIQWYLQAANNNHSDAQYNLALLIEQSDPENAQNLLERAAKNNHPKAIERLQQKQTPSSISYQTEDWFGAARSNNVALLTRILDSGFKVTQTDKSGRSALFYAVEANAYKAAQRLLQAGLRPAQQDAFGISPLSLAVAQSNEALFTLLVKYHKGELPTLNNGDHLLHQAAAENNKPITQALIRLGADVNAVNKDGWTPLDIATDKNARDVAAVLIERNAQRGPYWKNTTTENTQQLAQEIISQPSSRRIELIEETIIGGKSRLLVAVLNELAVSERAKVHQSGHTFLSLAVTQKNAEIVQLLVKAKAGVNQTNADGNTPLTIAAKEGYLQIINILLSGGADPMQLDRNKATSIENAISYVHPQSALAQLTFLDTNNKKYNASRALLLASKQNQAEVVRYLTTKHRNLHLQDDSGRSALWYLVSAKQAELLEPVLKAGVKAPVEHNGKSAFIAAADVNCLACAKILLPSLSINERESDGTSALMVAARKNNKAFVSWLLANKADADLRNDTGDTALIYAVESNSIDIVEMLVEADVNLTRKNNNGQSALDIAKASHPDLYEKMKSKRLFGLF